MVSQLKSKRLAETRDEKKEKKIKTGPLKSEEGIPYDYIVIVDSGSGGSRVFVYNWLNPYHALQQGHDMAQHAKSLTLVKKFSFDERDSKGNDSESESDSDSENESGEDNKQNKNKNKGELNNIKFPKIGLKKNWHRKISPGISSFNLSPQKVGNRHIKNLLSLASKVVPKSEHTRTPIFLHSTAGMRLLPPNEQSYILENICSYIQYNLDFYIPDCATHINVIDGDIEGLYGWLSINYLIDSFDHPGKHAHGKNHTTYGLLDMGGASTQVVFQPNSTEVDEHSNNLYKIHLSELPLLQNESFNTNNIIGNYTVPVSKDYNIYSDSFLGFGMYQAHNRYLSFLTEKFRKDNDLDGEAGNFYGSITTPVPDPCLPKGYTISNKINDVNVDFIGESNFEKCLESIFPVLVNTTHSAGNTNGKGSENCKQYNAGDQVSSCLLNDLIPSFDFDVNHFVGVSGYWDALTHLLSYESRLPKRKDKNQKSDQDSKNQESYDYNVIYKQTSKLCSQSLSQLFELNNVKPEKLRLSESNLSELCFKSSWILNFLHLGLGFPRFGIDEIPNKDNQFKSLQLAEKLGGSKFSWTLGRALLYANDEYVQAFNNYTTDNNLPPSSLLQRPGYYYTAVSSVFHYGAEQSGISPRPQYTEPVAGAKYPQFDYETDLDNGDVLKWYVQPHRWYGIAVLMSLLGIIVWLMLGETGRKSLVNKIRLKTRNGIYKVNDLFKKNKSSNGIYSRVPTDSNQHPTDLEVAAYELNNMGSRESSNESQDPTFKIESDDESN